MLKDIHKFIKELEARTDKVELTFSMPDEFLHIRAAWPKFYTSNDVAFTLEGLTEAGQTKLIGILENRFNIMLKTGGE